MRINKIDQILVIGAGGTGSILLPQLVKNIEGKLLLLTAIIILLIILLDNSLIYNLVV